MHPSLFTQQDKVIINTLSMIAEDYAQQPSDARKIYQIVKDRLLDPNRTPDQRLPVLYVLDSILKNCKGCYIDLVEREAVEWMPLIYTQLQSSPLHQQKLQKVWRTWNEFHLFTSVENWKAMGRCFTESVNDKVKVGGGGSLMAPVAGIARTVRLCVMMLFMLCCLLLLLGLLLGRLLVTNVF